jgi:hypothetical protein
MVLKRMIACADIKGSFTDASPALCGGPIGAWTSGVLNSHKSEETPPAARRWLLRVDCKSTLGEKSETRRYEKEGKTRKRHRNAFSDFVLSEISPAQLNLFAFNRGVFVILLWAKQASSHKIRM